MATADTDRGNQGGTAGVDLPSLLMQDGRFFVVHSKRRRVMNFQEMIFGAQPFLG